MMTVISVALSVEVPVTVKETASAALILTAGKSRFLIAEL